MEFFIKSNPWLKIFPQAALRRHQLTLYLTPLSVRRHPVLSVEIQGSGLLLKTKQASITTVFPSLCPNNTLPLLRRNVMFCLRWHLFQCMHIDNAACNSKTPWAEFKLKETKHQNCLHTPQQHANIKKYCCSRMEIYKAHFLLNDC